MKSTTRVPVPRALLVELGVSPREKIQVLKKEGRLILKPSKETARVVRKSG
jgi:antitoxin component of MazEF toxin-antitoxin module